MAEFIRGADLLVPTSTQNRNLETVIQMWLRVTLRPLRERESWQGCHGQDGKAFSF